MKSKYLNRNNFLLFAFIGFLLSCNDQYEKKVVSTFPDGTPAMVQFFERDDTSGDPVRQIRYYRNGEKQEEGGFVNGKKDGLWTYWWEDGKKWSEGYFRMSERHGATTVWNKDGSLRYTGFYKNNQVDSVWVFYDGKGNETKEVIYKMGEKVSEKEF